MLLQRYKDISDVQALWERLYLQNSTNTFYQSYYWNYLLYLDFIGNKLFTLSKKLVFFVYDNKIIAPLVIDSEKKIISILGEGSSSDYLSFVFADGQSSEVISMLSHLFDLYPDYVFRADRINENCEFCKILNGFHVEGLKKEVIDKSCVHVKLDRTTPTHYDKLSKHIRQNYRTAQNRMQSDSFEVEFTSNIGPIDRTLSKHLLQIYKQRRQKCSNVGAFTFLLRTIIKNILDIMRISNHKDILSEYSNCQEVFYSCLKLNGEIASFCEGAINNNKSVSINRVSINQQYRKYSPGLIMLVKTIDSLPKDIQYFDLTRGEEKYKYQLGGIKHLNKCYLLRKHE